MCSASATGGFRLKELCLIFIPNVGAYSMISQMRRAVMSAKYVVLLRREALFFEEWNFKVSFYVTWYNSVMFLTGGCLSRPIVHLFNINVPFAIYDTSKTQDTSRFSVITKHASLGAPGINNILMPFKPEQP